MQALQCPPLSARGPEALPHLLGRGNPLVRRGQPRLHPRPQRNQRPHRVSLCLVLQPSHARLKSIERGQKQATRHRSLAAQASDFALQTVVARPILGPCLPHRGDRISHLRKGARHGLEQILRRDPLRTAHPTQQVPFRQGHLAGLQLNRRGQQQLVELAQPGFRAKHRRQALPNLLRPVHRRLQQAESQKQLVHRPQREAHPVRRHPRNRDLIQPSRTRQRLVRGVGLQLQQVLRNGREPRLPALQDIVKLPQGHAVAPSLP